VTGDQEARFGPVWLNATLEQFMLGLEADAGRIFRGIVERAELAAGDPATLAERVPMPEFHPALRAMSDALRDDLVHAPQSFEAAGRPSHTAEARALQAEVAQALAARPAVSYAQGLRLWERFNAVYSRPTVFQAAVSAGQSGHLKLHGYEQAIASFPSLVFMPLPSKTGILPLRTFIRSYPYFALLGATRAEQKADGVTLSPAALFKHDVLHGFHLRNAAEGAGLTLPEDPAKRAGWLRRMSAFQAALEGELGRLAPDARALAETVVFNLMHEAQWKPNWRRLELRSTLPFEPRALLEAVGGHEDRWAKRIHRRLRIFEGESPYSQDQLKSSLSWLVSSLPRLARSLEPPLPPRRDDVLPSLPLGNG